MLKLFSVGLVSLFAVLLLVAPEAEAVLGCNTVYSGVAPCLGYITGGALSPGCCPGIRSVLSQAKTKADRQSACGCLKNLAASYSSQIGRAQALLKICQVSLPFSLDPKIDCSKVN